MVRAHADRSRFLGNGDDDDDDTRLAPLLLPPENHQKPAGDADWYGGVWLVGRVVLVELAALYVEWLTTLANNKTRQTMRRISTMRRPTTGKDDRNDENTDAT